MFISFILCTFYLFFVCMQQIPESWEHKLSILWDTQLYKTTKEVQHELDVLFIHHEELRAKRSVTTQQYGLLVWFFGLIYFADEEEKAATSLWIIYLPLLTSLLLHWPVWKIRKFLYLYKHRKSISLKWLQDPWDERE